jgi:heat shock protein HspQ
MQAGSDANPEDRRARFSIGDVVPHRFYPFRGVNFDVDHTFSNTEEWYQSIPEDVRPARDQPYYHLLAENAQNTYEAYVSEQNLVSDTSGRPCRHPLVAELFRDLEGNRYSLRSRVAN